jgi:hypothetical protein
MKSLSLTYAEAHHRDVAQTLTTVLMGLIGVCGIAAKAAIYAPMTEHYNQTAVLIITVIISILMKVGTRIVVQLVLQYQYGMMC